MRKRNSGRKLKRVKGQRDALIKSMSGSLIMYERIETTVAKAKEVQRNVEKLITRAKKQDLASRRILSQRLPEKASQKLFSEIAKRYTDRPGGYTRIIKTGQRQSDASYMAFLELVGEESTKKAAPKAKTEEKAPAKTKESK